MCQVRKITALRWLRAAGIERRPPSGLANRGVTAPTAEELHDLVHVEHLSYAQIGERYGVDPTAVPYWLTTHNIPKPKVWVTRRKGKTPRLPDEAELRARRQHGESLRSIASTAGVGHATIRRLCDRFDIPVDRDGWVGGLRLPCSDGHEARSTYEQRVDNWLHEHGLTHELEPRYPFDRRFRADFLVGQTYIEVWGVLNNQRYTDRKRYKVAQCAIHGLPLIQINCWQFAKGRRWWRPLLQLLQESSGDLSDRLF